MTDATANPRPPARPAATRARKPQPPAGADDRVRQVRGRRRRQQILDAAVELFSAKGYRGTGLAALADRVGMTPTGLLYYFGTKERLLLEVMAERDRADRFELPAPLSLARLRNMGQHNVETAILTRLYAVLTAESLDADDPLHDFFVHRYETARQLVREILAAEVARGALRLDVDADQIATEVIATVMGLEIQWLTDPARVDLATAMAAYIDRLVVDLGTR